MKIKIRYKEVEKQSEMSGKYQLINNFDAK